MAEITTEQTKEAISDGLILGQKQIGIDQIANNSGQENKGIEIAKTIGIRGNPNWVKGISGNPVGKIKGQSNFSIRQDLIKSLKQIKRKNPKLYQEIIASYWQDTKLRPFLLEIIDGKARQQVDFGGNMSNPIRIIEVRANIDATNEAKTQSRVQAQMNGGRMAVWQDGGMRDYNKYKLNPKIKFPIFEKIKLNEL